MLALDDLMMSLQSAMESVTWRNWSCSLDLSVAASGSSLKDSIDPMRDVASASLPLKSLSRFSASMMAILLASISSSIDMILFLIFACSLWRALMVS